MAPYVSSKSLRRPDVESRRIGAGYLYLLWEVDVGGLSLVIRARDSLSGLFGGRCLGCRSLCCGGSFYCCRNRCIEVAGNGLLGGCGSGDA